MAFQLPGGDNGTPPLQQGCFEGPDQGKDPFQGAEWAGSYSDLVPFLTGIVPSSSSTRVSHCEPLRMRSLSGWPGMLNVFGSVYFKKSPLESSQSCTYV